jgi:hypothetical protein
VSAARAAIFARTAAEGATIRYRVRKQQSAERSLKYRRAGDTGITHFSLLGTSHLRLGIIDAEKHPRGATHRFL